MRPNAEQIAAAVECFGLLKYFPSGEGERLLVMRILERMVPTVEALNWLANRLLNEVGEWPGPKELRGLLCVRYTPLDGVVVDCSLVGFSAADLERASLYRRIAEYAHGRKIAGPTCCDGTGLTTAPPAKLGGPPRYAFCSCPSGGARRQREPSVVDDANSTQDRLLSRCGYFDWTEQRREIPASAVKKLPEGAGVGR